MPKGSRVQVQDDTQINKALCEKLRVELKKTLDKFTSENPALAQGFAEVGIIRFGDDEIHVPLFICPVSKEKKEAKDYLRYCMKYGLQKEYLGHSL
jgi:hypothetical protein